MKKILNYKKSKGSTFIPSYFLYQKTKNQTDSHKNLIDFKLLSLLEISRNIGQCEDLSSMIQSSIASIKKFFRADSVYIILFNEELEKNIFMTHKIKKQNQIHTYKQPTTRTRFIQSFVNKKNTTQKINYNNTEYYLLPLISQGQYLGAMFVKDFLVDTLNTLDLQIIESIREQISMGCLAQQLKILSSKDFLTNLHIRRNFEKDIENELIQFNIDSSEENKFSLILLDIDFFKKINDNYGHDVGDIILKKFSKILLASVREKDLVYRIGGEEFAILLSQTNQSLALKISKRIQKSLESKAIYEDIKLTASFGVSEVIKSDSFQTIFKRADMALYHSKENGRNKITFQKVS